MKKVCCSLLLLLFTFVCLFATIPKNKVSADTIIPSSFNYAINYFSPRFTSYNFSGDRLVINNELISGLYGSGASYNTFTSRTLFNDEGSPSGSCEYSGIYTQYESLTNNYWMQKDATNDFTFIDRYNFSAIGSTGEDLVLTLTFDTHYYDLEFLRQTNNFYGVQLPFVSDSYMVEYSFAINGFDESFEYSKNDVNWVGSNLRYHEIEGSSSREFIQNNFTYVDFMSFDDVSSYILNLHNVSEFRSVSVSGTIRIYIDYYQDVLLDAPNFSYIRKCHSYNSYIEFPESGGSVIPGMNLGQNMSFLPGGLPNSGISGECGECEDSAFIEDISTSLLNGVQNFLTFEISPGFSLYHILLLIVAIPLLILILKLFLGG